MAVDLHQEQDSVMPQAHHELLHAVPSRDVCAQDDGRSSWNQPKAERFTIGV